MANGRDAIAWFSLGVTSHMFCGGDTRAVTEEPFCRVCCITKDAKIVSIMYPCLLKSPPKWRAPNHLISDD